MKYLIIGNGPAGAYAAREIRGLDKTGEVTVLTDEMHTLYSRPRLPELISGTSALEAITLFRDQWYTENKIELMTRMKAVKIDPKKHTVLTGSGQILPYDRLLIATGSMPNRIPAPGIDGKNIFTLRTVEDAQELAAFSKKSGSIAVIGGGLLGLEAASALQKASGVKVTVIEFFDRLLPRQLDTDGARILETLLSRNGMIFLLGATTAGITDRDGQKKIALKDGREVSADFILVSAGIKVNTDFAKEAGIACAKGIIVNDRLETNIKDIFAAGDCAEHNLRLYGLWAAAQAQGVAAGKNMAGGSAAYQGTVPSTALKVAGISVASSGEVSYLNDKPHQEFSKIDREAGRYVKLFAENGIISGAILVGEIVDRVKIQKSVGAKIGDIDPAWGLSKVL